MQSVTRREFGAAAAGTVALLKQCESKIERREHYDTDSDGTERVFVARTDGIGERIRKARDARGLSIEQCAYAFDPTHANHWYGEWSTWESGGDQPPEDVWPTIEALLGVSATLLIFGGSEIALAKTWVSDRLEMFDPHAEPKPDDDLPFVSARIKQLRERHGLSVAECVRQVNEFFEDYKDCGSIKQITEPEWNSYENGYCPRAPHVLAIARLFGVEFAFLLTGEPDTGDIPA
jgi:transcriptional regulator with XRE-family HTH domain